MNFQNVPREEKLIKGAFIPKLDYLLFADYSQIEYRLLAYYLAATLGDYTMCDNFKAGIDPHSATARIMLGIGPTEAVTDNQRQVGKVGNFSIIYAGGVPTIIRQLAKAGIEISEKEAGQLLKKLRAGMPGVKDLFAELISTYKQRGYIMTIAGRRLTVDPGIVERRGQQRAESALLNYLIQGSAAELIRHALIKIHRVCTDEGLQSHMVNVVHDEVQIDGAWGELEILLDYIPNCMGDEALEEYVPIVVDIEISETSWAAKHALERN